MPIDIRYDIGSFLSNASDMPFAPQKIRDPGFQNLASKYQKSMQSLSNDPSMRQLLNNKVVAALFLDKVPQTSPIPSDKQLIQKYGYSSSTIDSMQIIHYLQAVKEDPRLAPETKTALENWIETEREYLDIAVILDGWRAGHSGMIDILRGGSADASQIARIKFAPPSHEVDRMAQALSRQIQSLQPGQTFKMLGGYTVHETRLSFRKNEDGSLSLYHYNTATGYLDEYSKVKPEVAGPQFWKDFIKLKLESPNMEKMEELLGTIGEKKQYTRSTKDMGDLRYGIKARQESNSCPAQAPEADLKHHLVHSASTAKKGELQYKLVKSLMVEKAVELEKGRIEPRLYTLLQSKERIKNRYLQWRQLEHDPQKLQEAKELYLKLIFIIDPKDVPTEAPATIALLRKLDEKLTKLFNYASPAQITKVVQTHDQLWPKERSPIACLKFHQHVADVKGAVNEVFSNTRTLTGRLKSLLKPLLPKGLLDDPWLPPRTIASYLRFENAEVAIPIVRELYDQQLLEGRAIEDLLFEQLDLQNVEATKGLAKIIVDRSIGDENLRNNYCLALLDPGKAHLSMEPYLVAPLRFLQLGGHREAAVQFIKKLLLENPEDSREIIKLACEGLIEPYLPNGPVLKLPEEWIVAALSGWMQTPGASVSLEAITPLRFASFSGRNQIQLLERYAEISKKTNLDDLVNMQGYPNLEAIRYLYKEKNSLSPSAAAQLFRYAKSEPGWEKELGLYLADGTIQEEMAYNLFNGAEPHLKKQIALAMLQRDNLIPRDRMLYLSYTQPEEFMSLIAQIPEALNDTSLFIDNLDDAQIEHLTEIAVIHTHASCFNSCLERLCAKQELQPKIETLFAEFFGEGEKARELDAARFLKTAYDASGSRPLVQSLYQICVGHFGKDLQGGYFDKMRNQGIL